MQLSNNTIANSGTKHLHHPEGNLQNGVLKKEITINGIKIRQSIITNLPYQPRLKERAKQLRRARNLPEVLFWMQVTKGNFHKIDFDRQRIIGNYIVDFTSKL